jgi:hypothetical protein
MNRKHRRLLILTLVAACAGAAIGTAFAVATDTASDPPRIADPQSEPRPDDDVVCPGIIFKVGLKVELPCGRGAKIVESAVIEDDGRYCARITYIADTGSPSRTETLCEGDVPSVGGEPVRDPTVAD